MNCTMKPAGRPEEMKKPPIFSASLMCMNMLEMKEQFRVLNERIQMYHVIPGFCQGMRHGSQASD